MEFPCCGLTATQPPGRRSLLEAPRRGTPVHEAVWWPGHPTSRCPTPGGLVVLRGPIEGREEWEVALEGWAGGLCSSLKG